MGILWLLVIACLLCIFKGLHAESPAKEHVEFSEDTVFIMNSLFGFRPCLDEACGSFPLKTSSDTKEDQSEDSAGSENTSKPPPAISPSPDPVVEYSLHVHTGTLSAVSIIEEHHPDIKDIRMKVVEGIVAYVARYSALGAENCNPAVKLLDFILLAVQSMRHEYVGDYVTTCNFTSIVDEKSLENLDTTEGASKTSKSDLSVTPDSVSTEAGYKQSSSPCDENNETVSKIEATVKPCPETSEEIEEIIVEDYGHDFSSPMFVGSVRGIPGVNYPNYTDVPITSFSCADKKYIPGFYADLETGCQVFHVCYEHRRESFLCPVGTTFNQPILACDYWYSSNCSLAPAYYEINTKAEEVAKEEEMNAAVGELITVLVESKQEKRTKDIPKPSLPQAEVDITKFLPVKAKVTEFKKPVSAVPGASTASPQVLEVDEVASQIFSKMVSSATSVVAQSRGVIDKIPESALYGVKGKLATVAGGVAITPVIAKAKLSAAASVPAAKVAAAKVVAPIVVKTKLAAVPLKVAVPVVAKSKSVAAVSVPAAKVAATKVAVPIAVKTKLANLPKVAAKVSAPVLKAKMFASAVPLTKSKMVAPALKGIKMKAVSAPLVKAKMSLPLVKSAISAPVPIIKAKLGAAAAISPLTKKALALGYMKLLKAKKLALLG